MEHRQSPLDNEKQTSSELSREVHQMHHLEIPSGVLVTAI